MSRDQFFFLLKLVFLSQKTKIYNDTILANYKKFVLPENQLILQKTVKNYIIGIAFLRKSINGSGSVLKFLWSPITRALRVVARNSFRCFTTLLTLFQMIQV